MTKLNQIIAIEKGVKADAARKFTDWYHLLQKPQLFGGITKTYEPHNDEGDQLPGEGTLVQAKAEDVLSNLADDLTRLFDVVLTKDTANMKAVADVVVGDEVLLKNVPVTYLLFLEKQLGDLRTVIKAAPLLDPSEEWTSDAASGVWRTKPKQTIRTKKVPKAFVKAPATDKHPAQVEMFQEDVLDGTWTTIKFSGALPADRADVLLARIDALQNAVKFAREEANSTTVTDAEAGTAIFEYLLDPDY